MPKILFAYQHQCRQMKRRVGRINENEIFIEDVRLPDISICEEW